MLMIARLAHFLICENLCVALVLVLALLASWRFNQIDPLSRAVPQSYEMTATMLVKTFPDSDTVARAAASLIATAAKDAVASRGRYVIAVSGGKTPWAML